MRPFQEGGGKAEGVGTERKSFFQPGPAWRCPSTLSGAAGAASRSDTALGAEAEGAGCGLGPRSGAGAAGVGPERHPPLPVRELPSGTATEWHPQARGGGSVTWPPPHPRPPGSGTRCCPRRWPLSPVLAQRTKGRQAGTQAGSYPPHRPPGARSFLLLVTSPRQLSVLCSRLGILRGSASVRVSARRQELLAELCCVFVCPSIMDGNK